MSPRQAPSAFSLPAALSSAGYALRPETDGDVPFLMRLYASTREDELALVGWSAAQKEAFLSSQFAAQRHHYRTALTGCCSAILEHDGAAVGRLYLQARQTQIHIVDIALLPACRNRGLGAAILRALQAAAAADGRSIGLMVATFNPALRLYRRLGFAAVADHGPYCAMIWRPTPAQLNTA